MYSIRSQLITLGQSALRLALLGTLLISVFSTAKAGPFEDAYNAASKDLAAGRTHEAQLKYQDALKLAPPAQTTMVRFFLASTYAMQQQPEKALDQYLTLLYDPLAPTAIKTLMVQPIALCYNAIGKPDKASEILMAALASGVKPPTKQVLEAELGNTYIYEKRYPEARVIFEKALAAPDVTPEMAPTFSLRIGTTYLLEKNFDAAIQRYDELLARPEVGTTSVQQMASAQSKQVVRLELAQARIGQSLQQQREILQSKFLSPIVESLAKENVQGLEQLQTKFLAQFTLPSQANPAQPKTATEPLKVGALAPDFTMVDANGKTQTLSDYRGKKQVLLTFFPKCFTGGCANHLSSLRDQQAEFDANNVQVLAVSVDPAEGPRGQLAFAKQLDLPFPLLPDTERKISMLYGATQKPDDMASRMSVLVDTDGIIQIIDKQVRVATHGQDLLVRMKARNLLAKRD